MIGGERPASDCKEIKNLSETRRKTQKYSINATMKKCLERTTHAKKPCLIVGNTCVARTNNVVDYGKKKSPPVKGKCGDIKPSKILVGQKRIDDMVKRCTATGKQCKTTRKPSLTCSNSELKKIKAKRAMIQK